MTECKIYKKLKRVVAKEEFVVLTGDFIKAVILNQFIYWSERVQDFDKFISEEKNRASQEGFEINIEPTKGWIYKKAEELSEETMLRLAPNTMHRHIKVLIDNGWLIERANPQYKWDRTKQYRVDLIKIQNDLLQLGYILQDYKVAIPSSKMELRNSTTELATSKMELGTSIMENGESKMDFQSSEMDVQTSKTEDQSFQNGRAIPEITTEITYRNIKEEEEEEGEEKNQSVAQSKKQTRGDDSEQKNKKSPDEIHYENYETVVLFYYQLFDDKFDQNTHDIMLPWIERLVREHGKENVIYGLTRLSEQENVDNAIRWLQKTIESPYDYPPKVSLKNTKNNKKTKPANKTRSERKKMFDSLLMS
ncbi:hypothetical protein [Desulfofalx alkaliphila]|uniref:hypothetical protein n=1 Tax=Desulfofalx alkaliphila TaxID=105483 RepID=UPI000691D8B9|nr:hypothetical protein [Desulfofalx alkaliphila]